MTRSLRTGRAAVALVVVAALGTLTACTAQPGSAPSAATTAVPASAQERSCPGLAEVAALTATPFTVRVAGPHGCDYTTAADITATSTVTVRHLAAGDHRTVAALRYAAVRRGRTTDLPAVSFDAFTAPTRTGCTVWFPGAAGVPTSVTARRDGVAGSEECGVAAAVATLIGASSGGARTVAVVAQRRLLGTSTADASWPWRIGRDAGVRIDRATGTGYLRPSTSGSLAAAAAAVPADSAAVVLVSGTEEIGSSRLAVLSSVTAALSAAAARAPRAKLIVVGPVVDATTPYSRLQDLRIDLRSAAAIARADYIDPPFAAVCTSAPALDAVADSITVQLRTAAVARD